ncbi:hypothetical protein OnM2_015039 [Erysiphe neolycopersici]|uniref:Uncharacterized protein n=1 Tax=Erysiphe neolycopersici TaxID=212602 RepID=A0A420I5D3_9PEZI|nr:hypothetical protein OnM2_015039 [Erysiphe neolycopersici]
MSTDPEITNSRISLKNYTQTISEFAQNIFRKYGLSEISLADIDKKKKSSSPSDLESTLLLSMNLLNTTTQPVTTEIFRVSYDSCHMTIM